MRAGGMDLTNHDRSFSISGAALTPTYPTKGGASVLRSGPHVYRPSVSAAAERTRGHPHTVTGPCAQ